MTKDEPVSEDFFDAIMSGGSIVQECNCGRIHFVSNGDYDEGELEGLRKSAAEQPNKYIEVGDDDSVGYGEIDGHIFVYRCPCNKAARYESFIWNNRRIIARYLAKATGQVIERAFEERRMFHVIERAAQSQEIADKIARMFDEVQG